MEEDEFSFQIEPLNLAEYATAALACRICDLYLPNIIKRLQQNGELPGKGNNFAYGVMAKTSETIKMEISETLLLKLNHLPEYLTTKIRTKALELIGVLYDWITYLMGYLRLDVIYLDKIYWTPKGIIDVEKIFLFSWINIPVDEMNYGQWFTETFSPLHYLACFFAQEQIVRNFQTEIIREIKDIFPRFRIGKNSDPVFRIMSVVIFCYDASEKGRNLASIEAYEVNEINLPAVTMLSICRSRNFDKAYVYFFNFLNASEEQNLIHTASQTYFEDSQSEMISIELLKYRIESRLQIKLFVLKKMNSSQKYDIIFKDFNFLFLSFLQKEDFQKYCIPLLDKFLIQNATFRRRELDRYKILLKNVISIIGCNMIDLKLDHFPYIELLELFMKKIPINIKFEAISCGQNDHTIIEKIYERFCVPIIKVIINDDDLQAHKIDMINYGEKKFRSLIEEKKYEDLEKFKTEILTSRTEEEAFDKIFLNKILKSWILDGRFDFVGNYLTWKYGDQAHLFKINLHPLWCSFIPKNYTNIKELLISCFGKQEMPSLNNCQPDNEILSLKLFCRELIYNIWFRSKFLLKHTHIVAASNLSNQILTSVFLSQVEIENFKKNDLVKDESCVEFYCANSLKRPYFLGQKGETNFEVMDEFFKFCGLAEDKLAEIKRSVFYNIGDWIVKYGVNSHRLDIVNPLLSWVNGDKIENREILKKYFPCPDVVDRYLVGRNNCS